MKNKKEIYLVPYAHLDSQWRWEYPTTINKYIKNTIEENVYLFDKYPGHRFNFTGALRYQFMKEYYPEGFEKVKKYVEEGRWAVSGTCLEETDALAPSFESMVRNILYGDRWAKTNLGRSSKDYMIPDCFGFPANMPSVLAHCGIHGFSSQKLTWGSAVGIPFQLGIWKGGDNSEIVCALNPTSYTSRVIPQVHKSKRRLKRLNALGEKNDIWKSFQYYGVGDIGGAPKESSVKNTIASIEYSNTQDTDLIVRQGSADDFFSEITDEERQKMDVYEGDFLLTNHSAGSITSATIMKRWNRKNEQLAFAAEVAAVTALLAAGAPYPTEKIQSAWYRIIGSQMHDILPGTSTPLAYEYSHNDEVVALNTWTSVLHDAALALAPIVKGDGTILLFNPLAEPRNDPVEIDLPDWDEKDGTQAVITDAEGKTIPAQLHKNEQGIFRATFIPDLKPFDWVRYSISPIEASNKENSTEAVSLNVSETEYTLENSNYRVTVSKSGKVGSIFHKKLEKELLKKPLAYEFQKEHPKQYPAWNMDWKDRKNPPYHRIEEGGEVTVLEEGPLRCTLRISISYQDSQFVKDISLSQGSEIVEFTERLNWRELGCSFKLALTSNIDSPKVTYNWETSRIKRGVNHEKMFEAPSRLWVNMGEKNWGVSLIEDSKYGFDHPQNDTLRMTLIYTPGLHWYSGYRDQKFHDWGEHTIRYAIRIHEGGIEGTDHLARRFNQKIRSFLIPEGTKSQPKESFSLFSLSTEQMGVSAVKKPEDTDGILIRVYERYGTPVNADVTFASEIVSVQEVNGIEDYLGDIAISGNRFTIQMEANGIHSYIVKIKETSQPQKVAQEPLKLNHNTRLIGTNGDTQSLFPAEITPASIQAGAITYDLAKDEKFNAMKTTGQNIQVPEAYNTISLLVGATEACDSNLTWFAGDKTTISEENVHIPAMTGFLGQWETRLWEKEPKHHLKNRRDYLWKNTCVGIQPGYINRDRLEWNATHTHKDGKDQAYKYGYLYTLTFEIPKGAKSIQLPKDERIHIMAATVSQQQVRVKSTQVLSDKYDF